MISLREIVDTSHGDRTIIVPSPWGYRRMTVRCPVRLKWALQRHRAATLRAPCDYCKSLRSFLGQDDNVKPALSSRSPCGARTGIVRCHCDVSTGYWLTIFSNLSLCGVKQNRRGHMPVNPYDDRKVSLRRPHGNGNLDIVRASYTRRKANVTEA